MHHGQEVAAFGVKSTGPERFHSETRPRCLPVLFPRCLWLGRGKAVINHAVINHHTSHIGFKSIKDCCCRNSWPLSHSQFWQCFFCTQSQRIQRQRNKQVDLPVCTRHTCERQHPRPVGQHQQAAWCGAAEDERLRIEGYKAPSSVYYMKQTIGNACGTIGALHAIANNEQALPLGAPLTTLQAT